MFVLNHTTTPHKNITKSRRLPFSGAKNFRDLGGYQTIDGRTVRWGLLYRSDGLNKLTTTDLKVLSALKLHEIVDFRSEYEKKLAPDLLDGETASRVVEIPILDHSSELLQVSRNELVNVIKRIDAAQFMTHMYMEFASRFTPEMRQFLNVLLSSNGRPILFHCTAGKDRTGFAAAVILRILGVPQDVVLQDYLLSNQYFFSAYRWNLALLRIVRGKQFAQVVKDFMMTQSAHLSTAFEVIDQNFGSFENYVYNGLGLGIEDTQRLKSLYLE